MCNWFTKLFGGKECCKKGENCCQKGEKCCSHEEKVADSVTPESEIAPKVSETTTDSNNSEAKTE
jgi:hypothetical protein